MTGAALALVLKVHNEAKSAPFADMFKKHAAINGVDYNLLRAICRAESNFSPDATYVNRDKKGNVLSTDYGLMQVNTNTFAHYKVAPTLDPDMNIAVGAKYLKDTRLELRDQFSIFAWIAAYNIGVPNVIRRGIINQTYVGRVYFYFTVYGLGA